MEQHWYFPTSWLLSGLFSGIILLWFFRGRKYFLVLFVFLLGCSGFLWARLDAHVPASAVQNFTGPERVTLRGIVDLLPEIKMRGKKKTVSFVLAARSITKEVGGRRKFFKVTGDVQTCLLQSRVVPQVGDSLRIFGELSAPKQVLNPGEFDYGKFLEQKNIHALFQTIGSRCVRITRTGDPWKPSRILAEARRWLAALIDKLYDVPEAAILKALVLGLRSDVTPEVRDQFMKTGTIHVFAISGLNITMIAETFYLMFLFSGLGYRKTALSTILIVIVYVGIAGAGIPVRHLLYPATALYGSDEFYKNIRKLGHKVKTFQQGDEVLMGDERMRIIAQSQKGTAFLMESGPWRILLISGWNPGLFMGLLRSHQDAAEIHAVFLPAAGQGIPGEFKDWLESVQPLLVVLPDSRQEMAMYLAFRRVPHLDLKGTGALGFRRKGPRLELASFLKRPLGVYSYS